ncbi:MAG: tRNA (adenosine(37)-N6)-threonylcarbamoyltransferase complex ATPase subunit type 1 TsaE [Chloroflexi bacterium]|nr:MAG: tRNA (adenosine(37)-N6)-threonylcarbamoyltransferase complex ATPase subunit type 1 TsaE [Anaerolineaceae bacterium 4572_32.2]RLC78364.1 MAG: tRNA (adenosine(37)-N6)-threonylcarbamoyltransferase complex ATPase subunit type 1 TsaE [Chloroflexota bacterium]RLC84271.1 MAG: tRNA (adenosine(37)-N6)-threonylcarbamoyltransferase complex ATPase subunit type 1 TsaE [Chloroflexota bacterium]HEY71776.1 tRNA (adenosine(37)-N6)-threonylcarbamoyltransferase complex ATPase subunit type 1 TsaE [Thermofle
MAPILDENTLEFVSRSSEQTQRLGARLGALLQGGDVICLEGSLGAGKTRLAQGIGRGWGVSQTLISPTFVLVREYARSGESLRFGEPSRLYHIDLYRISGAEEAWGLGMGDFLGDARAICIIEWAERARALMPSDHLWIRLDFTDHTRRALYFTAQGKRHTALLQKFRQVAFGA